MTHPDNTEPSKEALETREQIAWLLCCGKAEHCNAAEHAPDHGISADGYAERYGCECKEIQDQAARLANWHLAALDRFRAAERERCAAAVDCGGPNGCGEWFAKRGRGHKRDNGHCMAHEGYCAHDLAAEIRTGTSP